MLSRQYRLPGRIVSRVYAKGQFRRGQLTTLKILTTHRAFSRIAIVVPKRIDKRATQRNYIRRLIASQILPELKKRSGRDLVITVAKPADPKIIAAEAVKWFAA